MYKFLFLFSALTLFSCGTKTTPKEVESKEQTPAAVHSQYENLSYTALKNNDKHPVKWSYTVQPQTDGTANIIFKAEIETGWNIYSQHTAEGGPVPTTFTFESAGTKVLNDKEEGDKHEGKDETFGVNVIKFSAPVAYFVQHISIGDKSKPITGYLSFMACNNQRCLPPTDVSFSIAL